MLQIAYWDHWRSPALPMPAWEPPDRLELDLEKSQPLYMQLFEAIRSRIAKGEIEELQRLPPTRDLADKLGTSRSVVVAAYRLLKEKGYVRGRVGSGTYVTWKARRLGALADDLQGAVSAGDEGEGVETQEQGATRRQGSPEWEGSPDLVSFQLDPVLTEAPIPTTRATSRSVLKISPAASANLRIRAQRLREDLAQHLARVRDIHCAPEQIYLFPGRQNAIHLVARLLIEPGTPVLIEDPCCPISKATLMSAGAHLVSCPIDEEGFDTSSIPPAGEHAALIYLTPSHQFPTGVEMPESRRLKLLDWAHEHDVAILEDDADGELGAATQRIPRLLTLDRDGRVFFVGVLSLMPRTVGYPGYLIAPTSMSESLSVLMRPSDKDLTWLAEEGLETLFSEGYYDRIVEHATRHIAHAREALIDSLQQHFGDQVQLGPSEAGSRLVVWLPYVPLYFEPLLVREARAKGVQVTSMSAFRVRKARHVGLVLGYGQLSEGQIRLGVERLAEAWESLQQRAQVVLPEE